MDAEMQCGPACFCLFFSHWINWACHQRVGDQLEETRLQTEKGEVQRVSKQPHDDHDYPAEGFSFFLGSARPFSS